MLTIRDVTVQEKSNDAMENFCRHPEVPQYQPETDAT